MWRLPETFTVFIQFPGGGGGTLGDLPITTTIVIGVMSRPSLTNGGMQLQRPKI